MTDWIDTRAILTLAAIFIPLEQILPLHPGQRIFRKHWLNDVVYLLLNSIVIRLGFLLIVSGIMVGLQHVVPEAVGNAVGSQPLWLQVIEVVVIADIGFYFAHRTFHAVPFLWKFHAIHHSIEELDWLAAHRVHPLDQILTSAASYVPLFALGFSAEAIAIQAVSYFWQSHLIHSNARIGFGPLKWILASPQFHHWHHANEREAYDKNFAAQLSFIDLIGGTLFMRERKPAKYGVDDPVPDLYHEQLAYPMMRKEQQSGLPVSAGDAS